MSILNITDFYVLGLPIKTDIGDIDFIKVRDYPNYFADLQVIKMSKLEIVQKYKQLIKDKESEFLKELEKSSLYEISLNLPEIRQPYINIFLKVLGDEGKLELINKDNFDSFRKLIMQMNCIKEEKINPNPEIQRAIERSKRVKELEQGKLTFADMCSSIVVNSGKSYDDILSFTIYQFYMTFHRIGQFKNYDTSTLFATVSTEKINIESWSKHIDLYEEESHVIDRDKFKKTTGEMLK